MPYSICKVRSDERRALLLAGCARFSFLGVYCAFVFRSRSVAISFAVLVGIIHGEFLFAGFIFHAPLTFPCRHCCRM